MSAESTSAHQGWRQVLILSEWHHAVSAQFDHLRSRGFEDAINRAMTRRKVKRAIHCCPSE